MEPKSVSKSVRKTGITTVAAVIMTAILMGSIVGGAGYVYSTRTDAIVSELKSDNNRLSSQVRASQEEVAILNSQHTLIQDRGKSLGSHNEQLNSGFKTIADNGGKISATGNITTTFLPFFADQTDVSSGIRVRTRNVLAKSNGDLVGDIFYLSSIRDVPSSPFPRESYTSYVPTFIGTLKDSEPGSYASIAHIRTVFTTATSFTFKGTTTVVKGSGMGGLEGICGGGTFEGGTGQPTVYDLTFRFGNDCKANN